MTEVYIIRHGQTDSNVRNTYLGHTDIELNTVGMEQAKKLGKTMENIKIDAIYTSPLARAVQTAQQIVNLQDNLVMTMNYGLQERNFGIWDDLTYEEIKLNHPNERKLWEDDWINYQIPKGESAYEVHKRVGKTIDKIIEDNIGKKIAVVAHLGVIRHMISHLLNLKIEDSWHFTADNCSITTIEITDGYGVLKGLNYK